MSLIVLIGSGPLGLATNPNATPDGLACKQWISNLALDADVILAGQTATLDPSALGMTAAAVVVATENLGHLSRFVDARRWQDIF